MSARPAMARRSRNDRAIDEIDPLTIKIYEDVAFVHYYYSMVRELPDGKKKTENGRWTDILLKQGNKWVLIGDHGGSSKQDD